MHFSAKFIALVATTFMPLLASAVQFTNTNFNSISSGQQITLTWNGDGSNAKIYLEGTPSGSSNLVPVNELSSGTSGNSLTVTIPNVPSGTYAFKIKQSGSNNVTPQFSISGTSGATISALWGNNNNNNNNNNNCNNGNCNNNNNNNGYYTATTPYTSLETYVSTYVSDYGGTLSSSLSTSTSTTTYTSGDYYNNNNNNNCNGGCVNNNGNNNGYYTATSPYTSVETYVSNYGGTLSTSYSTTTYTSGANVAAGCTTNCPAGVTQISDGQIQAAPTSAYFNPYTTTTTGSTTYATATGTAAVVGFYGAAPKNAVGAGAAIVAGGLAAVMAL